MQQHRSFGVASVRIGTRRRTRTPPHVAAFGSQLTHRAVQRDDVAAVAVDESQTPLGDDTAPKRAATAPATAVAI
jgi:hypothetical protein